MLVNLLCLQETFKLKTKWIYELATNSIYKKFLSQKRMSYKHFERLWLFYLKVRF